MQLLESQADELSRELHPPLLSLSAFPLLRNALWLLLTLLCLLLTWHVMLRVMQREARLMMASMEHLIQQGETERRRQTASQSRCSLSSSPPSGRRSAASSTDSTGCWPCWA